MADEEPVCEFCGATGPDVETDWDPYELEIHGKEVGITACAACFQRISEEV